MEVKIQLEQQAKEYWLHRQRQAATPPHFTLCQDPLPVTWPSVGQLEYNVPMRVDVEAEGCKLREAFLWRPSMAKYNNDAVDQDVLYLQRIASMLCDDFDLDKHTLMPLIHQQLVDQLHDFRSFHDAQKGTTFLGVKATLIIDVLIGLIHVQDKLVVDVGTDQQVLMALAEQMAKEAELPAEFGPALSFSLLEQQYHLQRALIATGFTIVDGTVQLNGTADVELVQRLQTIDTPTTNQMLVFQLTQGDLEKLEQIRDREGRRKRRQTRSRRDAWALSSPPKLHRTALTYKGRQEAIIDKSEEEDFEEDEVYRGRTTLMMHTSHTNHSRPTSRRGRKRGRGRK